MHDGWLLLILLIASLVFWTWVAIKIMRYRKAKAERDYERAIEADMRQDMKDQATRKRIAEKILREAG